MQAQEGRTCCLGGGRGWSDVSISQGTPRVAGDLQDLGERRGRFSLRSPEGAGPRWHLCFRLPASRTATQYMSVVLRHSVCSAALCCSSPRKRVHCPGLRFWELSPLTPVLCRVHPRKENHRHTKKLPRTRQQEPGAQGTSSACWG